MAVASGGYCEGIDLPVDGLRPTHPWFGSNRAHPVSEARDEAQILADMLFTDQSDGQDAAGRQRDCPPEDAVEHENAFGVMSERPEKGCALCRVNSGQYVVSEVDAVSEEKRTKDNEK